MGGRGQGVGAGVPDVAAAVAVEVHRVGQVGGGNELGLAHGAGPGAAQAGAADVAALQDLQGRQQLVFGETWAAAFIGQGGEGADHRLLAHELAEAAFHAPDGDQRLAVDAVALLDGIQCGGVFGQQGLALAHAQRRDGAVEVFPDRAGELRLGAVGLDHAQVRGHAGEGLVEHLGLDAGLQGLGAEAFAPVRKVQCRCDGRGGLRLSRVLLGLLRRLGGRGGNQFGGGIRGFGTGAEEEHGAGEQAAQAGVGGKLEHRGVSVLPVKPRP